MFGLTKTGFNVVAFAFLVVIITAGIASFYIYKTQYLPSELRVAATNGNLELVERLLKKGVDANAPLGLPSNSVLNRAVESGSPAVVEAILKAGADPNAVGETGMTALMIASHFGYARVAEILLHYGAKTDVVAERHRSTALLLAVIKSHAETVSVLVRGRANVNQGAEWGDAPLCRARLSGATQIEKILMEAGAKCSSAESK